MSERRRYSIVLLLVLALMGGAIALVVTKPTILGLDLQGGVQLVYHAEPTAAQKTVDADSMQRSIDLMQQRVNQFGVSEAEINQAGKDQIEVGLPGVKDAKRAADQVGSTAQLFFYDWEANLLDEKCKTTPDVNANTRQPTPGLYAAVKAASKCTSVGVGPDGPTNPADEKFDGGPSQAAAKPRYYAFNKKTHQPYVNGQTFDDRQAAMDSLSNAQKANVEIL